MLQPPYFDPTAGVLVTVTMQGHAYWANNDAGR
jgi:hypothetical protein